MSDYRKYGDFSSDGKEFIITRPDTPRPWFNYAWNRSLVTKVDQRGRGMAMYRSPEGERTYLLKDRVVYLKDRTDKTAWTVGWDPVKLDHSCYTCRHGLGFTRLETNYKELESTLTITAAVEAPVEMWRIGLRNTGSTPHSLSVYPFVDFDLGGWTPYGTLECYAMTRADGGTLTAVNGSRERDGIKNNVFVAADRTPDAYEMSRRKFIGEYNDLSGPQELADERLRSGLAANEDMIACMQYDLDLAPGEESAIHLIIGPCDHGEDISGLKETYLAPGSFESELDKIAARSDVFGNTDVELPDEYLTPYINTWTKQQLRLQADYARLYMMGFRDTMQDAEAFCPLDPAVTRQALLMAMEHQYAEGSTLRAWWPTDTHKYADSGIWLIFTLAAYIKETGDTAFLEETVKYYDEGEAPVMEHARQALRWIYRDPGPHRLTRVHFGDWNDSLTIGRKGIGESVWLSFGVAWAQEQLMELARQTGDTATVEEFTPEREKLVSAIGEHCWDGEWYLRGFTDEGSKVGSKDSPAAKIFANSQTWAILSGIAGDKADALEAQLQTHLVKDYGLLTTAPSFCDFDPEIGRISSVPPGGCENGSSYCHVSGFKAVADCIRRDGDTALDTLSRILTNNPRNPIERSRVEPFAVTNMYFGPGHPREGEGFWGWFTGTGGWIYRAVTEFMLGVRAGYDGLIVDPVMPSAWGKATVVRRFRDAEYTITILNPQKKNGGRTTLTIDGTAIDGTVIPYSEFKKTHKVTATVS